MNGFRRVGIVYNSQNTVAKDLGTALHAKLTGSWDTWLCSADDVEIARELAGGTDVLVVVGGDGTILRAYRMLAPEVPPIVAINTGRVGFLTEIDGSVALTELAPYLRKDLRVEERAVAIGEIITPKPQGMPPISFYALNDIVMGRGSVARVAQVEARINGGSVATYRADGVIFSTATGSTGYALACGGPVLYPESPEMLVVPICPHLSLPNSLLVAADATVELEFVSAIPGLVSADGQVEYPVWAGDLMRAKRGKGVARFLRAAEPSAFYATLTQRLHVREQ